jgi:hypothetical protein
MIKEVIKTETELKCQQFTFMAELENKDNMELRAEEPLPDTQ